MSMEHAHNALRRMVDRRQMPQVVTGTVSRVNGLLCDVQPSDGGAELLDVRMKPSSSAGEAGCYAVPRQGSTVTVAMLQGNANVWAVVQVQDIERWVVRVNGNARVEVLPNGMVELNGAQYGGLVRVNELRVELQKVTTWLSAIRQAIAAAPVAPGDGGAAFKAAVSAVLGPLPLPDYNNIESQRTKHGA